MEDYPSHFVRGISVPDHVQYGKPLASIFQFQSNAKREDDFSELSVNWCDDGEKMKEFLLP
jgi:hypothetical protein